MARRPAVPIPGEHHAHDDFEGLLSVVWHEEQLDRTIRRLDAQIDRDESLARTRAASTQAASRKRASGGGGAKPRGRRRDAAPSLRNKRAGKKDEPGHHAGSCLSRLDAGVAILGTAAITLAVFGAVFTILMRLVRLVS